MTFCARNRLGARETAISRLIVISGPSGAGKGTLIRKVLPVFDHLLVSVSATTRPRRAGELEGRDYRFMTREDFLRRVEAGQFLEWAEFGGNLYGTPLDFVRAALDSGSDVLLEIELKGAAQVRKHFPDAVCIFIEPPDLKELEQRLRLRDTESEEDIHRRMNHARAELEELQQDRLREKRDFDYAIVNDDVEQAAEELRSAIDQIRANDPSR